QAWGESTRKGNTLYLHVFDWPKDGKLVLGGLKTEIKTARLLANKKGAALAVERLNSLDVLIRVPATAPDKADSVLIAECAEEPVVDSARLLSTTISTNTLRAFDGQLHGKTIRLGPGKARDAYLGNWSKADESISWPIRLNQAATFEVLAAYD